MNIYRWLRRLLLPAAFALFSAMQMHSCHQAEQARKRLSEDRYHLPSPLLVSPSPNFSTDTLTFLDENANRAVLKSISLETLASVETVGEPRILCRTPDENEFIYFDDKGTWIGKTTGEKEQLGIEKANCALCLPEGPVVAMPGHIRFPNHDIIDFDAKKMAAGEKLVFAGAEGAIMAKKEHESWILEDGISLENISDIGWLDDDTALIATGYPAKLYAWKPDELKLLKEWSAVSVHVAADKGKLLAFPVQEKDAGTAEYYNGRWSVLQAKGYSGIWKDNKCAFWSKEGLYVFDSGTKQLSSMPNAEFIGWHGREVVYLKKGLTRDLYIGNNAVTNHEAIEIAKELKELQESFTLRMLALIFIGLGLVGQYLDGKNVKKIGESGCKPWLWALAGLPAGVGLAHYYSRLGPMSQYSVLPAVIYLQDCIFSSAGMFMLANDLKRIKKPLWRNLWITSKHTFSRESYKAAPYLSEIHPGDAHGFAITALKHGKIEDAFTYALDCRPSRRSLIDPMVNMLSFAKHQEPLAKSLDYLLGWDYERAIDTLELYAQKAELKLKPHIYALITQVARQWKPELMPKTAEKVKDCLIEAGYNFRNVGGTAKQVIEAVGSDFFEQNLRLYLFPTAAEAEKEFRDSTALHQEYDRILPQPIGQGLNLIIVKFVPGIHPSGEIDLSREYAELLRRGRKASLNLGILDYKGICTRIAERLDYRIAAECWKASLSLQALEQTFTHGNLHYGNIIKGNGLTFLDLGDICLSRPSLDLALLHMSGAQPAEPVEFLRRYHRLSKAEAEQEWKLALFFRGVHMLSRNKVYGEGDAGYITQELEPIVNELHPGLL